MREEGRSIVLVATERSPKAGSMSSGAGCMFFEVVLPVDVNQVETNPVEHGQANMITPALQRWPFQLLQHGCYAGLSAVVAGNISGTVLLDLFHFLDVTLSVGTPSYCSILKDRTNVGLVGCLLDLAAAVMEVSPKKCSG